jgi:hypothetical protein
MGIFLFSVKYFIIILSSPFRSRLWAGLDGWRQGNLVESHDGGRVILFISHEQEMIPHRLFPSSLSSTLIPQIVHHQSPCVVPHMRPSHLYFAHPHTPYFNILGQELRRSHWLPFGPSPKSLCSHIFRLLALSPKPHNSSLYINYLSTYHRTVKIANENVSSFSGIAIRIDAGASECICAQWARFLKQKNMYITNYRECHGFTNPCGSQ